ncbi:MAG TPA: Phenylacetic acid catabolic protein, partial [Sinorhizobium sp.]|nr:Phenylacetic acid catabolic protein [Sinorhizobium sp.]
SDAALAADSVAPEPSSLKAEWDRLVAETLGEATLKKPFDGYMHRGGKRGIHTEHLGYVLAEMQFLQRAYPGATW